MSIRFGVSARPRLIVFEDFVPRPTVSALRQRPRRRLRPGHTMGDQVDGAAGVAAA
jgi:hypothetical protein